MPVPPDASATPLPLGVTHHTAMVSDAPAATGEALAQAIRKAALHLGFARIGFCPIEHFSEAGGALARWLAADHHGEMTYMAGAQRDDPAALLPRAKTLISVALPYPRGGAPLREPGAPLPLTGLVARYARGRDYHEVLKERLRTLADHCARAAARPVLARACVDTAPLLEREAARQAGLGFTAKSTMTIVAGLGTYVLLGELLIDLEVAPTQPVSSGCGSCRSCLDACPTRAFVDAYSLDARRCISYLTIELAGAIPRELRPLIGRWVFGCDICQEVCPFNHSSKPRPADPELEPRRELETPELVQLLELTSSGYRRLVRGTALRRVSRQRLQRNAAVALGNSNHPEAVAPLARALEDNPSALVREHVAWALGRLGGTAARAALLARRERETEPVVSIEIEQALGASAGQTSC